MDYEKIKVNYIDKKEAIAIANNDKTLKQAMYSEAKKSGMIFGLLIFNEFKVKLVKWGSHFAWHLKLIDGEWGATKYNKIFGIKFKTLMCDGIFTEEDNINCLVLIDDGEFIYLKDEDLKFIKEADIKEYEKNIK